MDSYDHNAHSVFLLYYQLILVVKYRRKVFTNEISDRAKEIFCYIAPRYGLTLEEWNHDRDHVHIMFRGQPKSELSRFVNAYKSASSRLLKKEFPSDQEKAVAGNILEPELLPALCGRRAHRNDPAVHRKPG